MLPAEVKSWTVVSQRVHLPEARPLNNNYKLFASFFIREQSALGANGHSYHHSDQNYWT